MIVEIDGKCSFLSSPTTIETHRNVCSASKNFYDTSSRIAKLKPFGLVLDEESEVIVLRLELNGFQTPVLIGDIAGGAACEEEFEQWPILAFSVGFLKNSLNFGQEGILVIFALVNRINHAI